MIMYVYNIGINKIKRSACSEKSNLSRLPSLRRPLRFSIRPLEDYEKGPFQTTYGITKTFLNLLLDPLMWGGHGTPLYHVRPLLFTSSLQDRPGPRS